jgi:uncharacterized protein
MKNLSVMIKPASALCNLRCKYCFYADVSSMREVRSYGIMQIETAQRLLDHLFCDLEDGDRLNICFQGGEPTVAGLDFFQQFVAETDLRIKGVNVTYSLQTNGLLLDEDWCLFLKKHQFLVGLSLDAVPDCHNACRVDPSGKGTYQRVLAAKHLLEKHGIAYNVMTVLTNQLARHPQKVWNVLKKQNICYLQLIPCLGELSGVSKNGYALTPKQFAAFYTQLFRLWLADYRKGEYRSIKLFDDLICLLAYGQQNACGITGHCSPQLVVEADGGVYPCDFYVLDDSYIGNLTERSVLDLFTDPKMQLFRERPCPQPKLCSACPYLRYCGGGCKRMRQEVCCDINDTTCGYRSFLDACIQDLSAIAREQALMRCMGRR